MNFKVIIITFSLIFSSFSFAGSFAGKNSLSIPAISIMLSMAHGDKKVALKQIEDNASRLSIPDLEELIKWTERKLSGIETGIRNAKAIIRDSEIGTLITDLETDLFFNGGSNEI